MVRTPPATVNPNPQDSLSTDDARRLGRVVDALSQVFGASVGLIVDGTVVVRSESFKNQWGGVASEAGFRLLGPQEGLLAVRIDSPTVKRAKVVVGPFAPSSSWISSDTVLENRHDRLLDATVPRERLTAAYVATIFRTLFALTGQPPELRRMTDDVAIENIRRIGAAIAYSFKARGKDTELAAVAPSFHRIRPLRDFVNELAAADVPDHITSIFENLTAGLPVGFHLVDLMGRSLIKSTTYQRVCHDVFRKYVPLECVISDLTQLWAAVFRHRLTPLLDKPHKYQCHGQFTEILCPIFAEELAVGAIFGGQIVETETQKEAIVQKACMAAGVESPGQSEWQISLQLSNPQECDEVSKVCCGLAGFTGTTLRQWCRAETESGLRAGLIEASQAASLRDFAAKICRTIQHYMDITVCSFWLFREERLLLMGTTADFFHARPKPKAPAVATAAASLIETAFYDMGEGLTGRVAKTEESIYVKNAEDAAGWFGRFSETPPGTRAAFVAIPLLREKELWGVFRASKTGEDPSISRADFNLLEAVAKEIAIGVREEVLAEQAKAHADRFKYIMEVGAHEFRGPLNIIVNLLGVLRRKTQGQSQDFRDLAQIVEEQAYRAKRQMDNALTFDIPIAYNFSESPLGLLFQAAEQEFTARAAERNVRIIVWDSAKRLPSIRMDAERIAQVITNLLDNAVKYSFKGEKIHVKGADAGRKVVFSIENQGTGIPERFRDTIFEPFKRKVVEDKTRFIAGTGLGLPIVKQILDVHNGTVSFTSVPFLNDPARKEAEHGHVVTFFVELPKQPS